MIKSVLLIASLGILAAPAFGQGEAFQASSLPQQARFEGLTETMGAVVVQATANGTVVKNSSITLAYSGAITNITAGNANFTVAGRIGATNYAAGAFPNVSASASGNNLTLQFITADSAFTAGEYIVVSQVRINVNGLGAGTTVINCTLSGTSAQPITNPITFTQATVPVASVISPSLTVAVTPAAASLATCAIVLQTFAVKLTERYPAALTSANTEQTFTPNTNATATGTQVQVVVSGVPSGMRVTPTATTVNPDANTSTVDFANTAALAATGALTYTAGVPAAATSTGAALTFTYYVGNGSDKNGLAESVTLNFSIDAATASIPPIGTTATVTAAVNLAPVTTTSTTTVRFAANNQGGGTVATIGDCVTNLLFPFITNQAGFDTSIQISNTTSDDASFGTGGGAAAQTGTCTLSFYPTDLTTQVATTGTLTAGTISAVVQNTTAAIPAGGVLSFLQSTGQGGAFKNQSGYLFAVCRFLNAHGFSFVTNGPATTATISQGLLALVIPNTVAGLARGSTAGAGESLTH